MHSLVDGEKTTFPLSDYVIDTTGVQVTDGEQVRVERISLSSLVSNLQQADQAKRPWQLLRGALTQAFNFRLLQG
jgi:hypothetical protein